MRTLVLALCLLPTLAFAKGGSTSSQASVGGIPVGTQGSSGIYAGYTMVGGDQFDGLLSVLHMDDPYARYLDTHVYYPGARSVSGALHNSYDSDSYHTGSQDANRGIAIGTTDTLVQNNGLTIRARTANASETPYINGRIIVAGMIASGGYLTVTPPAIVEGYVSISPGPSNGTPPDSWHPTFWIESSSPLDSNFGNSPGGQEYDFPEDFVNEPQYDFNTHGSTIGIPSAQHGFSGSYLGTGYHLYSLVMTNTGVSGYADGTFIYNFAQDSTNSNRPYQVLITNHTTNNSAISLATWNALGTAGATIATQYYRVWLPNGVSGKIIKPLQKLPVLKVAFNTPFTYSFPSLTTLWNLPGTTDYCQGLRLEDEEPGSTGEGQTGYFPFPAELNWNASTRVLSGSITSRPGRLHVGCIPYMAGGSVGYTARGYIDVGPSVTVSSMTAATHGTAYSFDLYAVCDVGTLLPKTITVSGLPAGLTFSAATGLVTGTPSAAGSSTVAVTVTNTSGQSITSNLSLTVN